MRRWTAFLIASILTLAGASQTDAADSSSTKSLTARQKWARFAVVRGRVTLFVTRGQGGAAWTEEKPDGGSESFGICCEEGTVKLRYERRTADDTVLLQFFDARDLVLTRMPNSDRSLPLHFVQPSQGDVRLTVGHGAAARTVSAPSLWHLMLLEEELCGRELLPLLALLRHDWRLHEQAEQLRARLLAYEHATPLPDWEKLVKNLRDPRYQVRHAADRELRQLGQSIVPLLESVGPTKLDAEQRLRVKAICAAVSENQEDVPQRVVAWIINDKRLWQQLAHSHDESWRSLAAGHLQRLDPAPNPATKKTQLAANEKESK